MLVIEDGNWETMEVTNKTGWDLVLLSIDCVEDGKSGEEKSEGHGEECTRYAWVDGGCQLAASEWVVERTEVLF